MTDVYLRDIDLANRYKVSRVTIWRWASNGRIPRPVKLSPGCTRWLLTEINEHDAKIAAEAS